VGKPRRSRHFGRDLISRGLGAPMLIVADGAPGLTKAIEQCWTASDRQRCGKSRFGGRTRAVA
jgi:transposase-like protein